MTHWAVDLIIEGSWGCEMGVQRFLPPKKMLLRAYLAYLQYFAMVVVEYDPPTNINSMYHGQTPFSRGWSSNHHEESLNTLV